jgi:hypothetical protein
VQNAQFLTSRSTASSGVKGITPRLMQRAQRDLVSRSAVAAMVCFVLLGVVVLSTDYYRQHPIVIVGFETLFFLTGLMRLGMGWLVLKKKSTHASVV